MFRLRLAPAVVNALFVNAGIVLIDGRRVFHIQIRRGGEPAAVGRSRGNGSCIHQGDGTQLALAGLGAFAVREVACGVADGELAVGRGVARTEAGAAEALADDRAGGDQIEDAPGLDEAGKSGHGAGIDVQRESAIAAASAAEDIRRRADVVEGAAGAARDLTLLDPDAAVVVLGDQIHGHTLELLVGVFLHQMQNVRRVLL